ncbi:hypothetical protein LCGC14_2160460 [marine sediment metagenome]|uniref:DNA (cytosine-5-)-methyltransferase n=1 Tax=marine sediment metagenome TaxID=412755 RepID=A0A0F9GP30_9ZZZZ
MSFERLSADASAYVDERGNRLDVAWINTRMNSAKMIGYSSRWERPNQGFVGEPVPKTRAITPHEARISVVELRCLPHPAAGWGYLDFRPKAGGKPRNDAAGVEGLKVGSLFSGIGGFDLAARWMGWETKWYSEIDPYACRVMEKHFPEVRNVGDITTWKPDRDDAVDLICGGFPCQPVSLAGKGLAQEDERWLWPHFERVVRVLRPRYVVVENTPGLLSAGMGDVLSDLASSGYDAEWLVVSAAEVGAPHRR